MGMDPDKARRALGVKHDPRVPAAVAKLFGIPAAAVSPALPAEPAEGNGRRTEKAKRGRPEFDEQVRLVANLRGAGLMFSGSLNGVFMPAGVSGQAKAAGMERGDPDVTIWTRPPAFPGAPGMLIELKLPGAEPKTARADQFSGAKPHQRERLEAFQALGWHVVVAYGCADALCKIRAAGYDLRALPACAFHKGA